MKIVKRRWTGENKRVREGRTYANEAKKRLQGNRINHEGK